MFFPERETKLEIMDDVSITDERIFLALNELSIINKYLGGIQTTKKGVEKLIGGFGKGVFSILDIGAGFSDVFNFASKSQYKIIHLDLNIGTMRRYKAVNRTETCICADALKLCLKEKSCDIVHLSLFLHHLTDLQIRIVITELLKTARIGIVINELRRNIAAYLGITLLTTLFSRSRMVKHDGPLSVRKAFTKTDFENMLAEFPVSYIIKRKWAFRWLVCIFIEGLEIN